MTSISPQTYATKSALKEICVGMARIVYIEIKSIIQSWLSPSTLGRKQFFFTIFNLYFFTNCISLESAGKWWSEAETLTVGIIFRYV